MSTPLNDALVASQAKRSSDRSGAPRTRLRGRRLILARVLWVAVVTLIVALFLARLPAYDTALQAVCTGAACGYAQPTPDSAQALQKLGLSVATYAAFTLALDIALAFLCFALGAVIFWRRSDDWMALLGALAVVASVALNPNVYGMDMSSAWGWLAMVMYVFGTGMYLLVLSLSDGRFVTRWARWLLLFWVVAVIHYFIFMNIFYQLVWLAALGLLLIAQAYRHRSASSPLQRQQGKWFLFGGCVEVIIGVGFTVPLLIFPSLGQAGSFYQLVAALALIVLSLIFPLSLGLAILRYRLWDIDIIIHRTLVYSTLTVLLAAVYFGLVFALQFLLRGLISQTSGVAIVVSTLAIAALFQPLRRRIQSLIDRRFYRRKYDAARTLAAFSATIRDEVDLNQLCTKLTAVVEETMQPAHVSLWLCPPKRSSEETTRALPTIDTIGKP
jgi:MFS family permease